MLENEERRDSERGTLTQSGSSVGLKGFDGRFGLRMVCWDELIALGGVAVDRAILPFSNHHFCRSELAGGRPGSIES
jgi:hypothetical protein